MRANCHQRAARRDDTRAAQQGLPNQTRLDQLRSPLRLPHFDSCAPHNPDNELRNRCTIPSRQSVISRPLLESLSTFRADPAPSPAHDSALLRVVRGPSCCCKLLCRQTVLATPPATVAARQPELGAPNTNTQQHNTRRIQTGVPETQSSAIGSVHSSLAHCVPAGARLLCTVTGDLYNGNPIQFGIPVVAPSVADEFTQCKYPPRRRRNRRLCGRLSLTPIGVLVGLTRASLAICR